MVLSSWLTAAVIAVTSVVDGPGPSRPALSFERAAQPLPVAALLKQVGEGHAKRERMPVAGQLTALAAATAAMADSRRAVAAWVAPPEPALELPSIRDVGSPPLAPGPLTQIAALLVLVLVLKRRARCPQVPGLQTLPPHVPASASLLGSPR